ncbi:zeta toxin family protein [Arcicella sp. DC2W]|uniref:Zeta toxin family protein n=1 Tax=Arcicella gelida TaxID=2984195 RepID=A0ABU5S3J5_9BACT|nr:zeta toxin family protein [Arcicella sp. DC2W]MEA5402980.1 zeta toxin family protein [Arcicella sp. DC2W]
MDLLAGLKERFFVNAEQIEEIKLKATHDSSASKAPSEKPSLIIVGVSSGSKKEELNFMATEELAGNTILLSADILRNYHPNVAEIKQEYPDMLLPLTTGFTKELLLHIEDYAIQNHYNVVLEASLGNAEKAVQRLSKYKEQAYEIALKVLSVNKLFSYLNAEEAYEHRLLTEKSGRLVSKQYHDQLCIKIPQTLQKLYEQQLLDKINIYRLHTFEENGALKSKQIILEEKKEKALEAYLNEQNRDFTSTELTYLKEKAQKVKAMKASRDANFLEKVRFDFNFKFILEGKEGKTKSKKMTAV